MSSSGIEVRDLTLRLGSFALRAVSLDVAPGEILVLLGANGAGKSVTLETIAGFHRPLAGHIRIAGRDVTQLPPEKRRIGFMVQDFGLFPHLSIAANVAIGQRARGGVAELQVLMNRLGIAHLAAARPGNLSPGEKQRAALARALAGAPDSFLFDEPFAALDAVTSEPLRDELAAFLRRTGVPAVFVTHDRFEAIAIADRVAVIDSGNIRQQGPAAEVFARPASIGIARFLGIENIIEGRIEGPCDGERLRVAVGDGSLHVANPDCRLAPAQVVTLCMRAEQVRLLPPQSSPRANLLPARVVALRRVGPLWKVSLDCSFPLIAYALPQTARACGLAPGSAVDAEIDADAIHVLA
ncbi:MAG TPA: ABC transporter ATP-binding protein [Stellaceae bacterium]|nr:ABC transporter ATP-binding protein [Stellaceae bacterium]